MNWSGQTNNRVCVAARQAEKNCDSICDVFYTQKNQRGVSARDNQWKQQLKTYFPSV